MSSSVPLLQVSLVGFAYVQNDRQKTLPNHQKIIEKELDGISHVETIDVRVALPVDPAQGGVSHTQNGTNAHTQQAVFSMEHYTELLEEVFNGCMNGESRLELYGRARNVHRSDVVGRHLEAMLNSVVAKCGTRVVNAKYFSLSEERTTNGVQRALRDAIKWFREPWMVVDAHGFIQNIRAFRGIA